MGEYTFIDDEHFDYTTDILRCGKSKSGRAYIFAGRHTLGAGLTPEEAYENWLNTMEADLRQELADIMAMPEDWQEALNHAST